MVVLYDYMKSICVCPGTTRIINMVDLQGNEPFEYPLNVYNTLEQNIGYASSKDEYIEIWNNDPVNKMTGQISGFRGPFTFIVQIRPGKWIDHVIGDTAEVVNDEWITEDGQVIWTEDGNPIENE